MRYIAHRPAFRIGPPGTRIPPSLAGRLTAVFGLCAQVWHGTAYGNRCLRDGQDVLALARTQHVGMNLTASPRDYYGEDTWKDDLEYGATELFLALREPGAPAPVVHGRAPRFYLRAASHWARDFIRSPKDTADTFNLYDTSEMAHWTSTRPSARRGTAASWSRRRTCSPICGDSWTPIGCSPRPSPSASGPTAATRRRTPSDW